MNPSGLGEWVGYLLVNNLADYEFSDFQQLSPWRTLVPVVADEIVRFTGNTSSPSRRWTAHRRARTSTTHCATDQPAEGPVEVTISTTRPSKS